MDVASWATVGWVGLGCELLGIGIALWGVYELTDELFPGSPLPPSAAWRWVKRKLGVKPETRAGAGTATVGAFTSGARGLVTAARPSDAASETAWNAYWDSRLNAVSTQIGWLNEDLKEADGRLTGALKTETAERQTAVARLEERLKVVVGGKGGRGLARTWWGLAFLWVGALLQGLASGLG